MKKVLKVFVILTIVGALFTAYQFLGNATYRTVQKTNYELSNEKVNVDFKIETARKRLEKGNHTLSQVETSKELKNLTAERDILIKRMNDQKAKEAKEERDAEQKTKTENLRLTLSFYGTLASTIASIIIAFINSRKKD